MKKEMFIKNSLCAFILIAYSYQCGNAVMSPSKDPALINSHHLDYLYAPVHFSTGTNAAGIYIYAEAPDYHFVAAIGEGFTCVDDVSRAALFYLRDKDFSTDTAVQRKAFALIRFILEMQADNGYFYNFLLSGNLINKAGATSTATPDWWSWRALQTLTEAGPLIKNKDVSLSSTIDLAINKIIVSIKSDLVGLPLTTKVVRGIKIPQWLPAGSGTDQAATLILALIPYCSTTNDIVINDYVRKLADGISLMQQGDAMHFPYACFLSWENQWHAYGSDQAYALLKAGAFLNDLKYTSKGLAEVDNFYPWLLQNGYKSSFTVTDTASTIQPIDELRFEQIAYGIRPMVFAAVEAYQLTGKVKYADMAGHLAAWFLGANETHTNMYSSTTGRCYDAISSANKVNHNSGAESTIEALLTLQRIENYPAVKTALNKHKKQ